MTAQDPGAASRLDETIAELDRAAGRLRSGDLDADEAAGLVERCAEIAAEIGAVLEQEARAARAEPPPGQETLL